MNFFESVFSDDPEPLDHQKNHRSESKYPPEASEQQEEEKVTDHESPLSVENDSNSNSTGWSIGGLIKTFATKSESVIQTYRRDLDEFTSGLKKETEIIREAASRAVKDLPVSIDAGASVAQESLESVGQAIDDFGSSVWRGTGEIISHGKDSLLSVDLENDSFDSNQSSNQSLNSKRYSRLDAQVHEIQTDLTTYSEEPEDLDDFNKWKIEFMLEEKEGEIEGLIEANGDIEGIYTKLVPDSIDRETFWSRYFYKIHKLNLMENARASLVKRVISSGEEEELSWDVDDDDEREDNNGSDLKRESSVNRKLEKDSSEILTEKKPVEEQKILSSEDVEIGEKSSGREINTEDLVTESISHNGSDEKVLLEGKTDLRERKGQEALETSGENMVFEGKNDPGESSKDSDFSVISSQPSLIEEEELGWDEIEDLGSNDEKNVTVGGIQNRADFRKRLSVAEEDEDLNWDIEDDDETVKH